MGMGHPDERASFDTRVDEEFVVEELLPTAVRVFPPLARAGVARTWCGLYEMTPDRHPIVGPAPGADGLFLANGFSGHGFQHAPIVGKLLAEMIVDGRASTVNVSGLRVERFSGGEPIREGQVSDGAHPGRIARCRGLGAGGGTRTLTGRSPRRFERRVSSSSTTPAGE